METVLAFLGPRGKRAMLLHNHACTNPLHLKPQQDTGHYTALGAAHCRSFPVCCALAMCSRPTHRGSEVWRLSISPPAVPGTEHAVKCGASVPVWHCLQCFGPALSRASAPEPGHASAPLHVQPHFSAWPCQWQLTRIDTPRRARSSLPSGLYPGACMCS